MIIITGHGRFASGLKTSLDLIVGNFDFVKPVDFTEDKSPESLKEEINSFIKSLALILSPSKYSGLFKYFTPGKI